ncbi:hypothetical protein BY458DRAFT_526100, partial [Sporodiniella umbellata]
MLVYFYIIFDMKLINRSSNFKLQAQETPDVRLLLSSFTVYSSAVAFHLLHDAAAASMQKTLSERGAKSKRSQTATRDSLSASLNSASFTVNSNKFTQSQTELKQCYSYNKVDAIFLSYAC